MPFEDGNLYDRYFAYKNEKGEYIKVNSPEISITEIEVKIPLKVGEKVTFKKEVKVENLSGFITIPKGETAYVGADKFLHLRDGMLLPIDEEVFFIKGYDTEEIAKLIWNCINRITPIDTDVLHDYDYTESEFIDDLKWILEEMGFKKMINDKRNG